VPIFKNSPVDELVEQRARKSSIKEDKVGNMVAMELDVMKYLLLIIMRNNKFVIALHRSAFIFIQTYV